MGLLAPVAESRLRYHAERAEIELISDARAGPYVGVHRMSALEFLARWADLSGRLHVAKVLTRLEGHPPLQPEYAGR